MSIEDALVARLEGAALVAPFLVHELNNALAETSGSLELLSEDVAALEGPAHEELAASVRGVQRGLGAVRDLTIVVRGLSHAKRTGSAPPSAPPSAVGPSSVYEEQPIDPRLLAELALALARPELGATHIVRKYDRTVSVRVRALTALRSVLADLAHALATTPKTLEVHTSTEGVRFAVDPV